MALTVATNVGALMAQSAASSVNKEMEISMERLSTGKRINSAADDAAGVAIASRLTSEIRGTNQAIRNAMDAQALIDTAEGAHNEVVNILQRMRELAVQAANDTNNTSDRTSLQTEMNELRDEIDRIAATTKWAGKNLLDGATPYNGGTITAVATAHSDQATFKFQVGSATTAKDMVTANIGAVSAQALSINGTAAATAADFDLTTNITLGTETGTGTTTATAALSIATGTNAGNLTLTVTSTGAVGSTAGAASTSTTNLAATYATGSFGFEIDGQEVSVTIGAGSTNSLNTGIADAIATAINNQGFTGISASAAAGVVTVTKTMALSVSNRTNAMTAVDALDTAISTVNTQRAKLGSLSNRLDNTVSNLSNISNNLSAGKGRIEDADFAAETTNLAKAQILQQASTAMLAQANASKQNVLSLLQG
jgi:flagellin